MCVCFLLLCFSSSRKKNDLNTKECVTGTNVQAAGPLDDNRGAGGQGRSGPLSHSSANKSPRLRGDSGRTAAGSSFSCSSPSQAPHSVPACGLCPDFFTSCQSCKRNSRTRLSGEMTRSQSRRVADSQQERRQIPVKA